MLLPKVATEDLHNRTTVAHKAATNKAHLEDINNNKAVTNKVRLVDTSNKEVMVVLLKGSKVWVVVGTVLRKGKAKVKEDTEHRHHLVTRWNRVGGGMCQNMTAVLRHEVRGRWTFTEKQ